MMTTAPCTRVQQIRKCAVLTQTTIVLLLSKQFNNKINYQHKLNAHKLSVKNNSYPDITEKRGHRTKVTTNMPEFIK
jgi:hypothetical protein